MINFWGVGLWGTLQPSALSPYKSMQVALIKVPQATRKGRLRLCTHSGTIPGILSYMIGGLCAQKGTNVVVMWSSLHMFLFSWITHCSLEPLEVAPWLRAAAATPTEEDTVGHASLTLLYNAKCTVAFLVGYWVMGTIGSM